MRTTIHRNALLAAFVAGIFAGGPALAEKPEWAGKGKPEKHAKESGSRAEGRQRIEPVSHYFNDQHRVVVRQYYQDSFRSGRCPPGLAKKNNGCLPPGQAKKWTQGRPLPRDVIYHDLPPRIVVSLGAPPAGHKYVRVATDILLIAIGTGMVVDAITDLGNM